MPYPPIAATDQEQQIKQFVKAGSGPVTLQTLALYTVTNGVIDAGTFVPLPMPRQ